jgi:hypothetical protein
MEVVLDTMINILFGVLLFVSPTFVLSQVCSSYPILSTSDPLCPVLSELDTVSPVFRMYDSNVERGDELSEIVYEFSMRRVQYGTPYDISRTVVQEVAFLDITNNTICSSLHEPELWAFVDDGCNVTASISITQYTLNTCLRAVDFDNGISSNTQFEATLKWTMFECDNTTDVFSNVTHAAYFHSTVYNTVDTHILAGTFETTRDESTASLSMHIRTDSAVRESKSVDSAVASTIVENSRVYLTDRVLLLQNIINVDILRVLLTTTAVIDTSVESGHSGLKNVVEVVKYNAELKSKHVVSRVGARVEESASDLEQTVSWIMPSCPQKRCVYFAHSWVRLQSNSLAHSAGVQSFRTLAGSPGQTNGGHIVALRSHEIVLENENYVSASNETEPVVEEEEVFKPYQNHPLEETLSFSAIVVASVAITLALTAVMCVSSRTRQANIPSHVYERTL